jgi:SAM-dependent methyltransferase
VEDDDHGHRATYDRTAPDWDAQRGGLSHEAPWLARLLEGAPPGAAVLDLGCGTGWPLAAHLIGHGCAVTGIDASPAMLALARKRLPTGRWLQADMRDLSLGESFHAILAWDSVFHLTGAEQRALIPRIAAHLRPGGRFLATVGPGEGEVWGRVPGGPVFHASLSPEGHALALAAAGLQLISFTPEDLATAGRSVLLARRP